MPDSAFGVVCPRGCLRFHKACFVCHRCKNAFPGGVFFEHEGAPYCKRHHLELFCAACGKCGEPVEIGVTLEGKTYHSQHFVCDDCGESVRPDDLLAWHCPSRHGAHVRSPPRLPRCAVVPV